MPTRGQPHISVLGRAQIVAAKGNCRFHVVEREPVTLARNSCVNEFLKGDETHLLFVDDDTVLLCDETVERLLALDADIASGVVPWWHSPDKHMIVNVQKNGDWLEPWPTGTFDITHAGTACMLIARRVFDAIEYPWFTWEETRDGRRQGEDVSFCAKALLQNLSLRCDASVRCDHIKTVCLGDFCPPHPDARSNVDPYSTLVPVLAACAAATSGPVLELGAGWYSTPLLASLCRGRKVLSLESDMQTMQALQPVVSDTVQLRFVVDWAEAESIDKPGWGLAVIDHKPPARRRIDLERLRDNAAVIVIHDSSEPMYQLEDVLKTFQFRRDYTKLQPHTTVVSNTVDLDELLGAE